MNEYNFERMQIVFGATLLNNVQYNMLAYIQLMVNLLLFYRQLNSI